MMKRQAGFSLIEVLVVIAILGFVLAATTDTFVNLLRNYKQQGKIAETNIEGLVGLEVLRQDIERAGFGLPWEIPGTMTYTEASAGPANNFNDSPNQPPRPILNGPYGWSASGSGITNSDYLVIKATNVATNTTAQLWTYMTSSGVNVWNTVSENTGSTDYVIVLSPGTGSGDVRTLQHSPTQLQNVALPSGSDQQQPKLVFGIWDSSLGTAPLRPFNRADYFIQDPSQTLNHIAVPSRCAPNTGVLVKQVLDQNSSTSTISNVLPLLDCVADMKVIFRLDTNGDGTIDLVTDNLTGLSARDIRKQVREIRVYILAQEGQKDTSYSSPSPIYVGDLSIGGGHYYNVGANINYRWKLYTIVIQPKNMRQAYDDNG